MEEKILSAEAALAALRLTQDKEYRKGDKLLEERKQLKEQAMQELPLFLKQCEKEIREQIVEHKRKAVILERGVGQRKKFLYDLAGKALEEKGYEIEIVYSLVPDLDHGGCTHDIYLYMYW